MSTTIIGRKWQSLPQKYRVPCFQSHQKHTRYLSVGSEMSNGIIFSCQPWYFYNAEMHSSQLKDVAWRNLNRKSSGNPFRQLFFYYLLMLSFRILMCQISGSDKGTPPPKMIRWQFPFLTSTILSAEQGQCYESESREMLNLESADIRRSLQTKDYKNKLSNITDLSKKILPKFGETNLKANHLNINEEGRGFFYSLSFLQASDINFEHWRVMGKTKTVLTQQFQRNRKKYYQVEKILQKRIQADGSPMYKVRWSGYTDEYDTWQPLKHLQKVMKVVEAFDNQEQKKSTKSTKIKISKISKLGKKSISAANDLTNQKMAKSSSEKPISAQQMKGQKGIKTISEISEQNQNQSPLDEGYFKVDKIVERKFNSSKKKYYYRVRWVGFDQSSDTWQPIENLKSVMKLVEAFDDPNKSKKTKKQKGLKFFEIEKIVDKKIVNKRELYKIRWNGFTQAQDTWEPKANLKCASPLIQAFDREYQSKVRTQDIGCTLKETDNYEVGGIYEDSSMEQIGLIGLVDEYQESVVNIDQEFISINMQEEQLIEPNFL